MFLKIFACFFFNSFEKKVLKELSYNRLLLLNFIVKRVFSVNSNHPYSIHYTTKVGGSREQFIIEDNSISALISLAISGGCYIQIHEETKLYIGKGTLWAPNITIVTGNHDLLNREKYLKKDIKIGRNCWLAAGCVILPGVEIGDNVTVAANAVVNKSFPSNVVIGGVPAKLLKKVNIEDICLNNL